MIKIKVHVHKIDYCVIIMLIKVKIIICVYSIYNLYTLTEILVILLLIVFI